MDGTEKLGEEDYAFFDGFKIVVFGWDRFGWDEEVYYGNTPVEVVRCMSERSWVPGENGKPKEYMAGFQSRYFGERIPLFHDEESFLQLLIKDDRMKIYKWEWEPEK
tara:strand:+ start:126 stop:446 length:321 start_codon:yes stop_codon:yes gene_type:complete